jgi:small subunit ribosomal protein S10
VNRKDYYVVTKIRGRAVTFQLTNSGQDHLTKVMKLKDKSRFDIAELVALIERGWAYTNRSGPSDLLPSWQQFTEVEPDPDAATAELAHVAELNHDVILRFESSDQGSLDTSLCSFVEKLLDDQVNIVGPFPLPTRVERYKVLSATGKKEYCVYTHKRIMTLVNPKPAVMQKAAELPLPPGVDVKVRERLRMVTLSE